MSNRRMNSTPVLWRNTLVILLAGLSGALTGQEKQYPANTKLWDTLSPFADKVSLRDRSAWKLVPANLLFLESDPAAAISDPAYYGREYSFKGDAVVENEYLSAVFCSKSGKVLTYLKTDNGERAAEITPLRFKSKPASITSLKILQNTGDAVSLKVTFSAGKSGEDLSFVFSFGHRQVIAIRPSKEIGGISVTGPVQYGIVPSFIGDDLIFDPAKYPLNDSLCIPSENLFLGLMEGENSMLVMCWPPGNQKMRLIPEAEEKRPLLFKSVDFQNNGKSIYLALLSAPGIWHKEKLKPSYLEKDIAVSWQRPFPAKWITQLYEAEVKTTYRFREYRQKRIWRATTGAYVYPVWFKGGKTFYHLSKKIPPKGDSIVYFLERRNTPPSVSTPAGIMKETLGRDTASAIIDREGRKLRSHHRRGSKGVRRAATCGCTEAIEAVFKEGEEVKRKEYVKEAVDDMVYFVTCHVERIREYQNFARRMEVFLNLKARSSPQLKTFLNRMEGITQKLTEEHERQKENIKTLQYAHELARKTKALTESKSKENPAAFSKLSKKWRRMGGAQDYLVCKFHTITRKLFQEAGYLCVNSPQAVEVAGEIRSRCEACLRNPDGYEIWPNY